MSEAEARSRHPASGGMSGRKLADDGELELNDKQAEFLDWLTGGRPEGETQDQFAERMGVTSRTVRRWKKDRAFLRRWEDRMRENHAHPDVLSKQLDVLRQKAEAGDIKAIELYWRLVDRMSPDRVEHVDSTSVSELSNEQLEALIVKEASEEQDRRLKAVPRDATA